MTAHIVTQERRDTIEAWTLQHLSTLPQRSEYHNAEAAVPGQLWERVAEGRRNWSVYPVRILDSDELFARVTMRVKRQPLTWGLTSIDDE